MVDPWWAREVAEFMHGLRLSKESATFAKLDDVMMRIRPRWNTFIAITALLACIGCGDESGSSGSSGFTGTYLGTFTGDDFGTWVLTVAADGSISGTAVGEIVVAGSRLYVLTGGPLDSSGNFTLTVPPTARMWEGRFQTINIGGENVITVSGSWIYPGEGAGPSDLQGTFSGSKGNYTVGTWSGTFTGDDSGTWSLTVASDRSVSGQFVSDTDGPFDLTSGTGTISDSGKFLVGVPQTARVWEGFFIVTLDVNGAIVYSASGIWVYSGEGSPTPEGTFTGSKN